MNITLGFDVYGTLIDTQGVIIKLKTMIGEDANRFSQLWREKQLEYTFRRGLMKQYRDFGVCTRQALDYATTISNHNLDANQKQTLIAAYSSLPCFDDVITGLNIVRESGFRIFAFSNGQANAVATVLTNAGISGYFEGVVSVDSVQSFKPDPNVYQHFIDSTKANPNEAWLISSNGFDVVGAIAYGMKAVWLNRLGSNTFEPWEFQPTVTCNALTDLNLAILNAIAERTTD